MALSQNPVPDDLYPLATEQGVAIPLAIARPIGSYKYSLSAGISQPVTLPNLDNIVSILATKEIIITTPGSSTFGAFVTDSFIALPDVQYELALTQDITLEASEACTVYINILQPWAQLGNPGRYSAS